MHATSVIDTVAVDMTIVGADQRKVIPIGGIAHAVARRILKIEVQTDNGVWQQAQLRPALSQLSWVVWRYDWAFQRGKHTFAVRCYEGNATPQIVTPSSTRAKRTAMGAVIVFCTFLGERIGRNLSTRILSQGLVREILA